MLFYATSIDINLKDPHLKKKKKKTCIFLPTASQLDVGREMFGLSGYNFYCRTMPL